MEMWQVVAAAVASLLLVMALARIPVWRRRRAERCLAQGRETFHLRREWLEAEFLKLASKSGSPRGLSWAECEFADDVAFARDRTSGNLRALVAVAIKFEAIEGGGMEDVEGVHRHKAATVVFRYDNDVWHADNRAFFNLSPAQTIERFHQELELVD